MKGEMFQRSAYLLALLSIAAALSAFAQNPDRPIRAIGEFSNMRFTEEHAYGYAVDLWRDIIRWSASSLFPKGLRATRPLGC